MQFGVSICAHGDCDALFRVAIHLFDCGIRVADLCLRRLATVWAAAASLPWRITNGRVANERGDNLCCDCRAQRYVRRGYRDRTRTEPTLPLSNITGMTSRRIQAERRAFVDSSTTNVIYLCGATAVMCVGRISPRVGAKQYHVPTLAPAISPSLVTYTNLGMF